MIYSISFIHYNFFFAMRMYNMFVIENLSHYSWKSNEKREELMEKKN